MPLRMRVHDREPIGAALRRFKKLLEQRPVEGAVHASTTKSRASCAAGPSFESSATSVRGRRRLARARRGKFVLTSAAQFRVERNSRLSVHEPGATARTPFFAGMSGSWRCYRLLSNPRA